TSRLDRWLKGSRSAGSLRSPGWDPPRGYDATRYSRAPRSRDPNALSPHRGATAPFAVALRAAGGGVGPVRQTVSAPARDQVVGAAPPPGTDEVIWPQRGAQQRQPQGDGDLARYRTPGYQVIVTNCGSEECSDRQ